MSTTPPIPRSTLVLAVTILGAVAVGSFVLTVANGAPYPVAVTDFGRDLQGAEYASRGENPYQEIAFPEPGYSVEAGVSEAGDAWIAHTPLSIALARGLLELGDPGKLEDAATWVVILAVIALMVLTFNGVRTEPLFAIGLCSAATLILGVRSEIFWIQGASLAGIGLTAIYWLDAHGRRVWAIVCLGALVAWRPWLAPLALFLPGSRSSLVDASSVSAVAIGFTGISVPFAGGLDGLRTWLTTALPDNSAFYQTYEWNQSLTGPYLSPSAAAIVFVALALVVSVFARRFLQPGYWPFVGAMVILTAAPLVWSQYWLALIPCGFVVASRRPGWMIAMYLPLLWPLGEWDGMLARFGSYLAVLIGLTALAGVVASDRQIGAGVA